MQTEIKSAFSSYLEGDVFLIYAKAIWFSTALCKENKKGFYQEDEEKQDLAYKKKEINTFYKIAPVMTMFNDKQYHHYWIH